MAFSDVSLHHDAYMNKVSVMMQQERVVEKIQHMIETYQSQRDAAITDCAELISIQRDELVAAQAKLRRLQKRVKEAAAAIAAS